MADRYWVGGTDSWNATAGSKWATTSGGAGGAAVPTAADDVFFDAASGTPVVTIPASTTVVCRSIDCTGYTGTLAFAATSSLLNIGDASGGALTFVAGMTLTLTAISTITLVSTSTNGGAGWAVTTGGKTMPNLSVANGGKFVLQDALTCSREILNSGTLDTNNQTVALTDTTTSFSTSQSSSKTLILGSSSVSCAGNWNNFGTNLTVDAGTSTITMSGGAASFTANNGTATTYNNLVFSGISGLGVLNATASSSFNDVSATNTAVKNAQLTLNFPITCSGTLTLNGNSATNRLLVQSSVVGTARTITAAALVCTNVVHFQDITGAGAATWTVAASGATAFGDCLGNSGITFTTLTTRYGVVAGNWSAIATWATTSGGAGGASVPLPQDAVVLDANSAAGTYDIDMPDACKDLTCTGFTRTLRANGAAFGTNRRFFGNVVLAAGMTAINASSGEWHFVGRGAQTFTANGVSFANGSSLGRVSFSSVTGSYTFQDAFSIGTGTLQLLSGTLDFNAKSVTINLSLDSNNSTVRTLDMTNSTVTITNTVTTTVWNIATSTNLTLISTGSTIVLSTASANVRTFAGGGKSYNVLTYTVAGSTGGLTITGVNTFDTINFSDITNARTLTLPTATSTTITTLFNVNGTAGKLMTVTGDVSSSVQQICDYLSVSSSDATGGPWYAGANSTNGGSNTGWLFVSPVSDTVGVRWDIRSALGDTAALLWDIRTSLGDTTELRWDARSVLADVVELIWDVLFAAGTTPIGDVVALLWDARSLATDSASLPWSVRSLVNDQVDLLWNARGLAGDISEWLWDVRSALGDSLVSPWDVRAVLGDTTELVWDNRQTLADSSVLLWDVLEPRVPVGDSFALQWSIRQGVSDAAGLLWGIRTPISDLSDLRWGARTLVGDSSELLWNIRTVLGDSSDLRWNTRTALTDQSDFRWGIKAPLGDQVALPWSIRTPVGDVSSLLWGIRTPISDLVDLRWGIRVLAGDTSVLSWGIRTFISDQINLPWNVLVLPSVPVGDTLSLLWGIRTPAGDEIALVWSADSLLPIILSPTMARVLASYVKAVVQVVSTEAVVQISNAEVEVVSSG